MHRAFIVLIVALVVTGGGASAAAQESMYPAAGARLRVSSSVLGPRPVTGTLVSVRSDTLQLQVFYPRRVEPVPAETIHRLEVSHGKKPRPVGIALGAAIGLLAGVAVGSQAGGGSEEVSAVPFIAGGTVVGGLLGVLLSQHERWEPIEVRTSQ